MKDQVGEDAGTPPAYFAMVRTEPEAAPRPEAEAEPQPSPAAPQPDIAPETSATAPQAAPEPEREPSATAPKQEPERLAGTPVASGSEPDTEKAAAGSALGLEAPERSGSARPKLESRVETETPAPSAPIVAEPAPPSGRESLFEAVRVLRGESERMGREMERLA